MNAPDENSHVFVARLKRWDGEPRPLHQMNTAPLTPEAQDFLQAHGCQLAPAATGMHIIFPEGSTRTELYPRTYEGHFRLRLPDGIELEETQPRERPSGLKVLLPPEPSNSPTKGEQSYDG